MQRRHPFARADVFRDEVRLVNGNVQPRFLRVFDGEDFLFGAVEVERLQSKVFPDAMLDVDDEVAFLQFRPI